MHIDKDIQQWSAPAGAEMEVVRARMGVCGLAGHFHDRWSIGVILRGVCSFHSGGHEHTATKAELFIIPPYEVHYCSAASEDVVYQVMYLADARLAAVAPRLKRTVEGGPLRTRALPAALLRMLAALSGEAADEAALALAFGQLDQFFDAAPAPSAAPAKAAHPLQDALHRQWPQALDLAALEQNTVHSRWHAVRTFQRQVGLSPRLYLRQLRALKARHLLQLGKPLAEVASALHFADQAHFSRAFKDVFGVSPGKLQRVMLGKAGAGAANPKAPGPAPD